MTPRAAVSHDALRALSLKAYAGGGQRESLIRWSWDVSKGCQSPVTVELYARPAVRGTYQSRHHGQPAWVVLQTPCRKCRRCRQRRARMWRTRAEQEMRTSVRTWFGTLTLRPEEQYLAEVRAISRLRRSAVEWSTLDAEEQFTERCRSIGEDVTLWVKRVRKQSGAKLRYLLVVERHKSGDPHLHALVHEVTDQPVRHAVLRDQWRLGFSRWKLIPDGDAGAARYVAKYLGKDAATRVRASRFYGTGLIGALLEQRRADARRGEKAPHQEGLRGITRKVLEQQELSSLRLPSEWFDPQLLFHDD